MRNCILSQSSYIKDSLVINLSYYICILVMNITKSIHPFNIKKAKEQTFSFSTSHFSITTNQKHIIPYYQA